MIIPLKRKYLVPKPQKAAARHAYRGRTGPRCCNDGCPSKKRKKVAKSGGNA